MKFSRRLISIWALRLVLLPAVTGFAATLYAQSAKPIDFSRDVKPILSQQCYACHGPDESSREAGLRLDRADAAVAPLDSGAMAVVPGDPKSSELIARISAGDASLRMPPADSGNALSRQQVDTLRRWIAEGARFDDHWSFRPVSRPLPPEVANNAWVRNPIDRFVLARLEREGLQPSPEADRATLLRRLSLDLLGLPPRLEEIDAFVNDDSPMAYERLVDRLLASPHFGERWGRHWLDLAHYADSDGYLGDALRPYAWLYRDWVIDAVNRDLPFDQFTIEQLAGDLLPDATLAQRTATGFLRNTLRNTEAGVDLEEYRLKEIVDRVNTVGIGWLGLSLGCAECHSHKFDPISHREFYELFSFFNNADDVDVPAPLPGEVERYQARLKTWSVDDARLTSSIEAVLIEQNAQRSPQVEQLESLPLLQALATQESKRTADQRRLVEIVLSPTESKPDDGKPSPGSLRNLCEEYQRHAAKKPPPPSTRVMTIGRRKNERVSYVHLRGDYRSRGEDVQPGTPAVLPPLSPRAEKADRLDLAQWLVDPANPLTPRVTVNRYWKHLFGRGLVASIDNFGAGGEPPSHPELLDWLATQFRERGWSRKALLRLVVTSATYRQVSHNREELEQRDPLNTLLARQQRFRLEAETVRDAALRASGLLHRSIGGPGFRPPQPAYVTSISRNAAWEVSKGPDLYRRGMYILFRRATPYPMLLTFDTPDSTAACVARERSNSPLQALTLLNDPVFFETARALGEWLAAPSDRSFEERATQGFRSCLARDPRPAELGRLKTLFESERQRLATDPQAARAIVGSENSADVPSAEWIDWAAWVVAARVLMNLDEFITRE